MMNGSMLGSVKVIDRSDTVIDELHRKLGVALAAVGDAAISNVKPLVPVGTPESTGIKGYMGGTLRGSIDKLVDDNAVHIGTNVEYAKYVEFRDNVRHLTGQAHYLRDGVGNHIEQYRDLIQSELTKE